MSKDNDFQPNVDFLSNADSCNKKITDNDLKNADLRAIQKHNNVYSDYLETFVREYRKKSETQRTMKTWFFILILALLFAVVLGSIAVLIIVCAKESATIADSVTAISASAASVSSFLILPKVIAQNLFPSKEDDRTAEIFGKMFEHDINIRSIYKK